MMKKQALLLLAGITLLASCEKESEDKGLDMGKLHISKAKPMAGDQIDFKYTKADSIDETFGLVVVMVEEENYPQDVDLTRKGEILEGSFKIPDSATAIAFGFETKGEFDNNDENGYVITLNDEEGNEISNSASSAAFFKLIRGSQYGIKYSQDSAAAVLKRGWADNADHIAYLYGISRADKKFADSIYRSKIEALTAKESLTEEEYTDLSMSYSSTKNTIANDSLVQIIKEKFPLGSYALGSFIGKVQSAKTLEEKEAIVEEYESLGGKPKNETNYMYNLLARAELDAGNTEKFKETLNKITDKVSIAYTLNDVAWNMALSDKDLETATQFSKESLDLLDESLENKPAYYSTRQFKDRIRDAQRQFTDTYAYIHYKKGDYDKAIALQEGVLEDGDITENNENYILFLVEGGKNEKAIQQAEKFIANNQANAKLKEYYKSAFAKVNPDLDYQAKLVELETTGRKMALKELREDIIDDTAPAFALQDMEGKEVALADLKGKTVIVDFWATWCGPCISSFPAMEKARQKYEQNGDVEFLFVNTWERTPKEEREKAVASFLEQKQLPFHVLLDSRKDGENYDIVSQFKVDGIPTKFIIGPDGKIKFKSVGWSGKEEEFIDELGMMIELSKS